MMCINCGEPLRGSAIICAVCGVTQATTPGGSGLAMPFDTKDWQPTPSIPADWMDQAVAETADFGIEILSSLFELLN